MAGVAYDALQEKKTELIRKMTDGSVFVAPFTADAITTLTDTDKLLKTLPADYEDIGFTTDDGAQFGRDVTTSEITSWGRVEPTRSDITSDTTTLQIAMQETKKATIGLYTGADLTAVTADATTGEVGIEKPASPRVRFHRVLALGVDLTDSGELYVARFLPRAKVDDYDDQAFQSSDDEALLWSVTFKSFIDDTLGYSEKWLFGGEGWFALKSQMGF
jgi:hypothetical protein